MIDADRLRQVLDYDPITGDFRWRMKVNPNVVIGSVAGAIVGGGYRHIGIDKRPHKAHRLAWLHVHGVWPTGHLDHINGNRDDNRIANLRLTDAVLNGQNRHRPHSGNRSGFLGVSPNRGKWQAGIKANGKIHYLGRYETPEEASAAYLAAKRRLHPGWAERAK